MENIRVLLCEAGHHGGSVKRAGYILRHMIKKGNKTSFLAFYKSGKAKDNLDLFMDGDCCCLGLTKDPAPDPIAKVVGFPLPTFWGLNYFVKALLSLLRFKPSIVYLNNTPFCHLPMIFCCIAFRIPMICHMRDSIQLTSAELFALRKMERIIVLSHKAKQFYVDQGVPQDRIKVVYNGISLQDFECLKREDYIKFAEDKIRLVLVGSLIERKMQKTAIEIIEKISMKYPDVVLFFIGDGQDREMLEKSVEERGLAPYVRFLGQKRNVAPYLMDSDIGLMLSNREGMPNVILEYMAASLPVVATDLPGIEEMVREGRTGFIAPLGNLNSLVGCVDKLISDKCLRVDMGNEGRKVLESGFFTIEKEMSDVENTILDVNARGANETPIR